MTQQEGNDFTKEATPSDMEITLLDIWKLAHFGASYAPLQAEVRVGEGLGGGLGAAP